MHNRLITLKIRTFFRHHGGNKSWRYCCRLPRLRRQTKITHNSHYAFLLALFTLYWEGQYPLSTPAGRKLACFVFRPDTRSRQFLKVLCLRCARINAITSFSGIPYKASMASNGVRSSHAISIIRDLSSSLYMAKQHSQLGTAFTHLGIFCSLHPMIKYYFHRLFRTPTWAVPRRL